MTAESGSSHCMQIDKTQANQEHHQFDNTTQTHCKVMMISFVLLFCFCFLAGVSLSCSTLNPLLHSGLTFDLCATTCHNVYRRTKCRITTVK